MRNQERIEFGNKMKEMAKELKISEDKRKDVLNQLKKAHHSPDNGKNGFKFLKRQKTNAFGDTVDDEDDNETMSVISKSNYQSKVYEMGTSYLRSNKSTDEQKQKYKESLIIKPPEPIKRPDYLKDRDKSKEQDPDTLYQ